MKLPSVERKEGSLILIFGLILIIFFMGLGRYPLYDPDEGRNAEVAREMVVDGHWLPPTLNGEVRYQKPPLYYWMVAGSFKIWGTGEFAARLPSALAALLGVLVTVVLGRRLWGEEKGWWAGIILATSLIFAVYTHIVIFDMVLTLFITLSIALFWLGMVEMKKKLFYLSAFFGTLAFLTKGPIGVLIPAMAVGPPLIYRIRKGQKPSIPWVSMLFIFLVTSAPIYLTAELKSPGYCYKFFWEENILRYLTPRFHRPGPWYYYLVVILVGLFPWTWFLKNIPKGIERLRATHSDQLLFLGSWILLPTLFFTFSRSKLPHYILPTFPAWALLLAGTIPIDTSKRALYTLIGVTLAIYVSGFLFLVPHLTRYRSAYPLLEKAQLQPETPIVAYKATRYSLVFYSGRKIEVVEKRSLLRQALKKGDPLYIFSKKNRLPGILAMAQREKKKVQVISKTPQYILLLARNPLDRSASAVMHPLWKRP